MNWKKCTQIPWAKAAFLSLLLLLLAPKSPLPISAQEPQGGDQDLVLSYGTHGLERLTYRGKVLEDLGQFPKDEFHIWHMKSFDSAGHVLNAGEYGWGESNSGRRWDAESRSWLYTFSWGTIRTSFAQHGNTLDIAVTETNRAGSGTVFGGATVFPLVLHLPGDEHGSDDSQVIEGTEQPGVTLARYAGGEVAVVVPDARKPVYSGLLKAGQDVYSAVLSTTRPDSLPAPVPGELHERNLLQPGASETWMLSLRFAPPGTPIWQMAEDAFRNWVQRWRQRLAWSDRRLIGTVYLASSPNGDKQQPGGFPGNPRRYFNDSTNDFNVQNPAGLALFQKRVLQQALTVAENLRRMDAQGAITWDIEGEEYPQDTSYVCAPDEIARVAPEMETLVSDKRSPYAGMKLDDAYFKTIRDAGFRVGVCVRPQRFTIGADGRAEQIPVPDAAATAELVRKMQWAHQRWGATLFYLDSTVERDGSTLPAAIIEAAAAALPDCLLIPEESTPRMYRVAAPFKTFLFHDDLGTPQWVRRLYPRAFAVNMVNDVDPGKLAAKRTALVDAMRQGDILMIHADYWQSNDSEVTAMYREAHRASGH